MPEQISVVAPVDPESLNYQLQAASQLLRRRGPEYEVKIPNYRLSFLCEAGKTTVIPFPLPENFVCTRRAPLGFEWTRHSDDIKVDVWVDSEYRVNPYPLVATGDFIVDFGIYYVKHHRIDITVDNQFTDDTLMTLDVKTNLLREELYNSWYEPIVRRCQNVLTRIAEEEKTPVVPI